MSDTATDTTARQEAIDRLTSSSTEFHRKLGLFDGIMVVIGNTIGSGIFIAPAVIAATVVPQTGMMVILVWIVGGILALTGALSYSELGALMPRAGGHYVFLREALGDMAGFLYAWIMLLVIASGSIAFVAITCVTYLGYFVPMSTAAIKTVAIVIIGVLTFVNYRGVKPGSIVLNIFTVLKVLALALLIVAGLLAHAPTDESMGSVIPQAGSIDLSWISTLLFAVVASLFTYGGWQNIGFVAGELRDPRRTLPLSLLIGSAAIITIYVLTNAVYVGVLSVPSMAASTVVAADTMQVLWGDAGASFIALMILVSSFGITNAIILVSPRVYYALAKDRLFFPRLAHIHPKYKTPSVALLVQALWASVIVLVSDTFQQIMNYVVFMDWLFLALAVSSIYILRRKFPDAPRPYKVWGYPITPAVFIMLSALVIVNTLVRAPVESGIGVAIVLTGVPVYLLLKQRNTVAPPQAP